MPKKNSSLTNTGSSFLERAKKAKIAGKNKKSIKSVALDKEKLAQAVGKSSRPRLLFSMDATASREDAWGVAQEITECMFDAIPGELEIALAYHGGGRLRELTNFTIDKKSFTSQIRSVRCLAGVTALNSILHEATDINRLKVLIYIGDCFEESDFLAYEYASKLALTGIRCFFFHDRLSAEAGYASSIEKADEVFTEIARITKGAVFPFDANSPGIVASILEAIAYYSARGLKALKALNTVGSRKLLAAINN